MVVARGSSAERATNMITIPKGRNRMPASCSGSNTSEPSAQSGKLMSASARRMSSAATDTIDRFIAEVGEPPPSVACYVGLSHKTGAGAVRPSRAL
jgi:hypothetical protein